MARLGRTETPPAWISWRGSYDVYGDLTLHVVHGVFVATASAAQSNL